MVACGTATVNPASLESAIRARFAGRRVAVHDVSCRDGTEARVGARVSCTALNAAGTELVVTGTVTAIHDRKAQFRFAAARGIARGATVAAEARRLLEDRAGQRAAWMRCPAHVPIPTHPAVICRLTTRDGTVFDTRVAVDATGHVEAEVARTPRSHGRSTPRGRAGAR